MSHALAISRAARQATEHVTSNWNKAAVWDWFQRRFFVLVGVGVALTMIYIGAIVLPKLGSMNGSPVIPGWQGLNNVILIGHILTAIPPLLIGLVEFSTRARRASPRVHRWLGEIYCYGIWASAITGFLLAVANEHGLAAKAGFSLLAIVWFTTTLCAYITAKRKNFVDHRRWMIRSYAITLAVVSVRPMFLFGPPAGLDYETWYQIITWICWVPNLIIAEAYVRLTRYSGKLVNDGRRQQRSARRATA